MRKWIQRKPKTNINKGDDLLSKLCNIRGIRVDEANDFLNPSREVLHPATDLKNSTESAERIKKAIDECEKIVVSIDNDADGVTAGAIIIRYLQERTGETIPYIYAERDWGHGIKQQLRMNDKEDADEERNENALRNREIVAESDLLIIVDSSANDVEACERIVNELETDVVILDHHEINKADKKMEDIGVLMVNPQQRGCRYLNKNISGAGVVYKMVGLVEDLYGDGLIDTEKYIDLAGVGIYGDLMNMAEPENRYIVKQALLNIKNMGLERIVKSGNNGKTDGLTGDTIGFTISPLINGTARMGNIKDAIDLLLSDEDKEVKRIRLRMHKANEKRKQLQKEMSEKFTRDVDTTGKMIFIITDESTSGMNGLIAQEIAQKHKKPVFVGRNFEGKIQGSARSFNKIPLKTFFGESGLVEYASGHEGALGIGFKESNLDSILQYVEENMKASSAGDEVSFYDIHLSSDDLLDSIDLIEAFNHITGMDCHKILVRIDDIMVEGRRILGKNNNTVKFSTMDEVDLIKFRVDESYAEEVGIMDTVSVIGDLKWNIWTKFRPVYEVIKTMQVIVEDYRLED